MAITRVYCKAALRLGDHDAEDGAAVCVNFNLIPKAILHVSWYLESIRCNAPDYPQDMLVCRWNEWTGIHVWVGDGSSGSNVIAREVDRSVRKRAVEVYLLHREIVLLG